MFNIGEFARHGRVSVRMLRHYAAIGLLQPALVDRVTGYRSYQAQQFSRLNRIVALKDLGFTLVQVQSILEDNLSVEELRGMLRLRQAELQAQIATDAARLAQVEARLQTIEREGGLPADEVQVKRLPAVRVAELTARAAGFEPEFIAPVIGPLYEQLCWTLERAGLKPGGPPLAYYEDCRDSDSDSIVVHAAMPITGGGCHSSDLSIVDLPAIEQAATTLHRGAMDRVMPAIQRLALWIDANGYRSAGYSRELYLEHGADRDAFVTELQEPIVAAGAAAR